MSVTEIQEVGSNKVFGGEQKVFTHQSEACGCEMKFGVYLPEKAGSENLPVLFWLSGLTCTHENFVTKAGSQAIASELGVIVVAPDTSPRGAGIEGEDDNWDFGTGAGFYLNATNGDWAKNYNMYDYVVNELYDTVLENFNVDTEKVGISGHSMGGHGAITIGLKNQDKFASISAFSPILAPMQCPWGQKAFSNYLGEDQEAWKAYDSYELIQNLESRKPLLVEQGLADEFLEGQLNTDLFEKKCQELDYPADIRLRAGYDHSYYFISSFLKDHFQWHQERWNEA